jgi:hypothetical protein
MIWGEATRRIVSLVRIALLIIWAITDDRSAAHLGRCGFFRDFFRSATCDASDHSEIADVRACKYYAFASWSVTGCVVREGKLPTSLPISNHAQKKVRINSSPTGDPCESSVKWHSGLKPCGFGKTRAPGRNATVANLCIQALLRPFGSPSEEPFR